MSDEKAEFRVVTQAVRDEAKRWADRSPTMQQLVDAVDALDLLMSAFWVGPLDTFNAQRYSKAYDGFQQYMLDLLKAAVVEFGQLSKALTKIANEYDRMDEIGKLNLNQIFDASQLMDVSGPASGPAAPSGGTGTGTPSGASSPAAIGIGSLTKPIAAALRNAVAQAEQAQAAQQAQAASEQAAAAQAAAPQAPPTLPPVQLPTQPLVVTQPYIPTVPLSAPALPDLPPPPPPPPPAGTVAPESTIPTVLDTNWFSQQEPTGDSTLTITVDGEEI
jgi:hypothetical protein